MSSWLRQIRTTFSDYEAASPISGLENLCPLDQPQSREPRGCPYSLLRHRHIGQLSARKTCVAADTAVL